MLGVGVESGLCNQATRVTYSSSRGSQPSAYSTVVTIDSDRCKISSSIDTARMIEQNPEWAERLKSGKKSVSQSSYIDYNTGKFYSVANLPGGEDIATEVPFVLSGTPDSKITVEDSDTVICGYPCKVATIIVRSNTVKYWFTDQAGVRGSMQPSSDMPDGLVLMTSRNGNISLRAQSVEKIEAPQVLFPASFGSIVDEPMYRYKINNSGVIKIPVFNDEYIGIAPSNAPKAIAELSEDSVYRVAGGTVILKKVKLPESSDGWDIFAQVVQRADKDAYDRTGSVFVIPMGKEQSFLDALVGGVGTVPSFVDHKGDKYPAIISTPGYDAPVEMVRFFTPFGVGGYNSYPVPGQVWADSVVYHQEITHLAPLLKGEVWIGAYIGNWTDKAHKLSLTLKYHPEGRGSANQTVVPLFNSLNLMEQAGQTYPAFMGDDSLRVTVEIPDNIKNARLVYITTGHGGWGGGDEFNPKLNTILMDGKPVFSFIPWREDCSSYRDRNPASGNFSNGVSSSDLSRSNWCPGTITNPVYIPLGDLARGTHTFAVTIDQGEPEGGSFSYWCLSGAVVGEKVATLDDTTKDKPQSKKNERKAKRTKK